MRAILTYHSIDPSGSVISVAEGAFRAHVAALRARGVRVTTVGDLVGLPADADAVAFTFDDAYANFATGAWPALRDAGFPATLFVVAEHAGGWNDWSQDRHAIPHLPLLGWDALADLAEAGVGVEAHSRTHADLRGLTTAALADEMEGCAERIRTALGRRPEGFAYPYGAHDAAAVSQARHTWRWACTTKLAPLGRWVDPHRLPRLDAYYLRGPDALDDWGTPGFRRRLRVRALARGARAAVTGLRPRR